MATMPNDSTPNPLAQYLRTVEIHLKLPSGGEW